MQPLRPQTIHAQLVAESPVLPDGVPYGVLSFGGDVQENKLCKQTWEAMSSLKLRGLTLEIGSGGGRWTKELARFATEIVCVDATDKVWDHVAALNLSVPTTTVICKDGQLSPILRNQFPVVFSYDTFVHFDNDTFWRYIASIRAASAFNGYVILHHATPRINESQPVDESGFWVAQDAAEVDAAFSDFTKIWETYAEEGFGSRVVIYRNNK